MSKHTAAPWYVSTQNDMIYSPSGKDGAIVVVGGHLHNDPQAAPSRQRAPNMRLQAAAPELLKQLRIARDLLQENGYKQDVPGTWMEGINAAINKAEGK